MSVSYCDISTGELYTTENAGTLNPVTDILNELAKINAREIIINQSACLYISEEELKTATGAFVLSLIHIFRLGIEAYNKKQGK